MFYLVYKVVVNQHTGKAMDVKPMDIIPDVQKKATSLAKFYNKQVPSELAESINHYVANLAEI